MRRFEHPKKRKFWLGWVTQTGEGYCLFYRFGKLYFPGHTKVERFDARAAVEMRSAELAARKYEEGFVEVQVDASILSKDAFQLSEEIMWAQFPAKRKLAKQDQLSTLSDPVEPPTGIRSPRSPKPPSKVVPQKKQVRSDDIDEAIFRIRRR